MYTEESKYWKFKGTDFYSVSLDGVARLCDPGSAWGPGVEALEQACAILLLVTTAGIFRSVLQFSRHFHIRICVCAFYVYL